jgi:hypothetical protein
MRKECAWTTVKVASADKWCPFSSLLSLQTGPGAAVTWQEIGMLRWPFRAAATISSLCREYNTSQPRLFFAVVNNRIGRC